MRAAGALLALAQLGHGASDLSDCRWTDAATGAAFDLTPLTPESGHLAFHGVIGEHDSLLASVGYHPGFELADYIYYVNLCAPATGFSFDKCDGKPPASVYQTHKDITTHDDCFSLGAPDNVQVSLINPNDPEVGIQLLFSGGDECHKEVHHPKSSRGCSDTPGWKDREGRSCAQYASQNMCGAKFVPSLSVDGVDAYTACCASCTEWWKQTVTCPKLERPEHGAPITYTNMRQWPALATYSCESGYTLSGGYSKRECRPDGQWQGSPPQCIDEPYYGRGGRMGRYNHYDDGNDAAEDVQEVEVEIEWVHEPRSILVNMTCDRSQRHTWADVINMAHRVMPVEAEMCEYVVQWPSQFACPMSDADKAASLSRQSSGGWFGWAFSWVATIGCVLLYTVLYRDDVRDYVLDKLPPAATSFFAD